MVSILKSEKNTKKVDVKLNIQDIFDIINGINILIAEKENERNNNSDEWDSKDEQQLERYKSLLAEMQKVKGLIK